MNQTLYYQGLSGEIQPEKQSWRRRKGAHGWTPLGRAVDIDDFLRVSTDFTQVSLLKWKPVPFMYIKKHQMADLKLLDECLSARFTEKLSSTGVGCPGKWWSPHSQRYLKDV